MTDTSPYADIAEACATIARRHGGLWRGTHAALGDRLIETFDSAGFDHPGAADVFRFFAAAFGPSSMARPVTDGTIRLRLVREAAGGETSAETEIVEIEFTPF